ncbi:Rim13p [Sugiyamaella lignohabitans]|uniref:Cysteine protease RIM13 n=1 Tax=Sugiyamaella lignohabitans TaxID=796027 RepID=A0A167D8Y3_9ASCO|nr:Rim13p [Sugiyamaella lignohabitans]ANB12626.1 Rim13p [Sugiyamaella lignohabitans]
MTLSQSALADCSVVASLLSIISYEERTGNAILSNNIHPKYSAYGKYIVKLYFNGTPRRVIIDDYLPVSADGEALFVHSRVTGSKMATPQWPALIEKAYMKVMGGYDFQGSHSASDTFAFTGWVPEYILLRDYFQDAHTSLDDLWDRLYKGWNAQDLLICVGSGKLSPQESRSLGIVSLHDYAVLDIRESETGEKQLLVRNPWEVGSVVVSDETNSHTTTAETTVLGTQFWMSFRTICSRFESLYLNWNMSSYSQSTPEHFIYNTQAFKEVLNEPPVNSLLYNPQYSLTNNSAEPLTVVLHLARHLGPSLAAEGQEPCFLSMAVCKSNHRMAIADESKLIVKCPARNTSYCSLQFTVPPRSTYVAIVRYDTGRSSTHGEKMTLKAYTSGNIPIVLRKAPDEYPYKSEASGQWTKLQSGGNWALKSYCDNPQFKLTIGPKKGTGPQTTKLYLESDTSQPINATVLWGRGKYMQIVSEKDVIKSSGKYRTGVCGVEMTDLDQGEYTVILSTYEQGTLANFVLHATGNSVVSLRKLIPEKAGLFTRSISVKWNGSSQTQTLVSVPRKSKVLIELSLDADSECTPSSVTPDKSASPSSYRPHIRLGVYDQYAGIPLADTGDFENQPRPLVLTTNFEGDRVYLVTVERMECGNGKFNLQFHSEVPVSVTQ